MNIDHTNKYRVIAIDPSTNQTGITVIEVDLSNGNMVICFSKTFKRNDLLRGHQWMADVHGDRETAVYCYGEALKQLLLTWEPSAVAIEAPFLSRLPQAFKALTEIVTTFRNVILEWDSTVPVEYVDPPTVKKAMGVSGGSSDKNDMLVALKNTKLPIFYGPNVNIEEMTEHEIDATAVGVHYVTKYLYPFMG
jgi:Holliday junction resolvasome RuvABC endonuclease subunit